MSRDSPLPPKTASLWPGRMEGCGKSPAHTERGEGRGSKLYMYIHVVMLCMAKYKCGDVL